MEKIALTEEQESLLNELREVLSRIEKAGIEIVYDKTDYEFAAINCLNAESLMIGEEETEDYTEIDDFVKWGNIDPNVLIYDSNWYNLFMKFK